MTITTMLIIVAFVLVLMFSAAIVIGRACGRSTAHYPEMPLVKDVPDNDGFGGEYE